MTLYIHIGYHKTGTTAIQEFCNSNRSLLENTGLIYPQCIGHWLGHSEIAWAIDDKQYPWQDRQYTRREIGDFFRESLQRSRTEDVLISSEEFCRLEFDWLSMQSFRDMFMPYNR